MSVIDLHEVRNLIKQASTLVDTLDGYDVDDGAPQKKSGERAQLTRQLLVLGDTLDLAAGLTRNEYWQTKGIRDMLEDR